MNFKEESEGDKEILDNLILQINEMKNLGLNSIERIIKILNWFSWVFGYNYDRNLYHNIFKKRFIYIKLFNKSRVIKIRNEPVGIIEYTANVTIKDIENRLNLEQFKSLANQGHLTFSYEKQYNENGENFICSSNKDEIGSFGFINIRTEETVEYEGDDYSNITVTPYNLINNPEFTKLIKLITIEKKFSYGNKSKNWIALILDIENNEIIVDIGRMKNKFIKLFKSLMFNGLKLIIEKEKNYPTSYIF